MNAIRAWFGGLDKPAQAAVVVAVVGAIAAIIAAGIMTAPQLWTLTRPIDSDLQLVRMALTDSTVPVDIFENMPSPPEATPVANAVTESSRPIRGQMENPVIIVDITLRNTGENVAVLKTARFEIDEFRLLEPCAVAHFPTPISQNYDVTLPLLRKPFETINLDFAIAQEVAPNTVDRFTITVAPDLGTPYYDDYYLYRGRLHLIYDEDDKAITSEPFVLALGMPIAEWKAQYRDEFGCRRRGYRRTAKNLENIVATDVISNPLLKDMFDFFGRDITSRKENQEQRTRNRDSPNAASFENRRSS